MSEPRAIDPALLVAARAAVELGPSGTSVFLFAEALLSAHGALEHVDTLASSSPDDTS